MPGGLRQSCGSGSEDAVTIHVRVRAERSPGEKRVAATPDSIKKLLAAGATVDVESGAGSGSLITDAAYEAAGANIVARDLPFALGVLFHVRPLTAAEIAALPAGTVIAGVLCLLLSDLGSVRSLGPVAAIGIASALLGALTLLPAILLIGGRRSRFLFWPRAPHPHAPVAHPVDHAHLDPTAEPGCFASTSVG